MRHSAAEKQETIRLVEDSELQVTATLREMGIPRRPFYGWYRRYQDLGAAGSADRHSGAGMCCNRIPEPVRQQVVDTALSHPEASPQGKRSPDDRLRSYKG